MLVFMDESGDTGLRRRKGSSSIFIIALVVFQDIEEAEAVNKSITSLRKKLGFVEEHEFHFTSTRSEVKRKFFETVARHNFSYHGIVIQKDLLPENVFDVKDSFYAYVCHLVFQNARPHLYRAKVILDRRGDKTFHKTFGTYLKKRMNQDRECIKKVVSQNSKSNNLIQLSDMICGAIKCCFKPSRKDLSYRKMISHLEMSLQVWPRE